MAIQKINLGTEPLGEGGDTYRSANTKINENFSNTSHAASRLVGTSNGQVPLVENLRSIVYSHRPSSLPSSITDANDLPVGSFYQVHPNILNGPAFPSYDISTMKLNSGSVQKAYGFLADNFAFRILKKFGGWSPWMEPVIRSEIGTAATKDVGTNTGNVMEVGAFGLGRLPNGEWSDFSTLSQYKGINSAGLSGITNVQNQPQGFSTIGSGARTSHLSFSSQNYAAGFVTQAGKLAFYMQSASSPLTSDSFRVIYHTGNTTLENGYLKPSSPVLRLSHNKIIKEHEAKDLDIKVDNPEKGVYKITGTTGLRKDDGWYFSPPKDEHFNILCMVEIEEEGDIITVKTYAKKFDFEKVAIVPDYDNPVDIIGEVLLRFNDLPEEQLDESELYPVEEPIEDEEEIR